MNSFRWGLLGLVVSSLLVIAGFSLPWASATAPLVQGINYAQAEVVFTGRELFALAAVMGWVGLAALAGLLATRGWGRVAVGAVVLVAGLITSISAIRFGADPQTSLAAAATDRLVSGASDSGGLGQWARTPWWAVGLVGGLGLLASGGLILVRGRTWPGLNRRYERTATAQSGAAGPISSLTAWDALDRGEDPTI